MKLRTSFFNLTALKKDLTRFAPVWGLYTIFQLLFVLLLWENEGSARFMNSASGIMQSMGILNFAYAGLCAILLFGDLFTARMCNALHALPMRREGWFLTHLTAGLLFCIGPNLLGTLLATLYLQQYCYGAFLWLGVTVLQFLFFFGIGTFCVMCAGNRLGAIATYGLSNFLSVLVAWLATTFYEPVLYGVTLDLERFANFSPVVGFSNSQYIETHYDNMTSTTVFDGFLPEDWRYLFIAAAVGAVLLALGLLIYRKRRLESAGDFISLRPVSPVFLVLYTLCVGAVMYFVAEVMSTEMRYIFLVIGFAIGFFTGLMLLERKVNVFRKKRFAQFGLLVLAFVCSLVLTILDPIGITRYVPEAPQVSSVRISPYASHHYLSREGLTLTEQEDIQAVIGVHQDMVDNRQAHYTADIPLYIRYEMKNGTYTERLYYVGSNTSSAQVLKAYFSSPAYVLGTDDIGWLLDRLAILEFYSNYSDYPYVEMGSSEEWVDPEMTTEKYGGANAVSYVFDGSFADQPVAEGLLEAIKKDCLEGNMAQLWDYHRDAEQIGSISFQYRMYGNYYTEYRDITVYSDCVHTAAYLKSLSA